MNEIFSDRVKSDLRPVAFPSPDSVAARYFQELSSLASRIDTDEMARIFTIVCECIDRRGNVFVMGNGGSAATSGHIATDWMEASLKTRGYANFQSLSQDAVTISRIANDWGFDSVFARQLEGACGRDDVVILISVSARSDNLVQAARKATELGATVVSLLGVNGPVADESNLSLVFGSSDYGLTEDLHLAFGHAMVRHLYEGVAQMCAPPLDNRTFGPTRGGVQCPT